MQFAFYNFHLTKQQLDMSSYYRLHHKCDFLNAVIDKYRAEYHIKNSFPSFELDGQIIRFGNWKDTTVDWMGLWGNGKPCDKPPVLFIWGTSDAGKSYWVRRLMNHGRSDDFDIYRPGSGAKGDNFKLQDFNEDLYQVFFFEEFSFKDQHFDTFKQLAEGILKSLYNTIS